MTSITFTFSRNPDDPDYPFLVHEVSNAFSFALIPVEHTASFETGCRIKC